MKSLRIFLVVALGLVLALGMVGCGDDDKDPASTYTLVGTYTYSSDVLTLTITESNADCVPVGEGPSWDVASISGTEMILQEEGEEEETWTRSSGDIGDITGSWIDDGATVALNSDWSWYYDGTMDCGDGGGPDGVPGDASVSGTLTLPFAADGKSYGVILDTDDDPDNGFSYYTEGLCGTELTVDYSVNNIASGVYYVIGLVHVVSESEEDIVAGDYIGIYGDSWDDPSTAVVASLANVTGVNIELTTMQ